MGYDAKGILVFNLKYEHAISFIIWSNLLSNVNSVPVCIRISLDSSMNKEHNGFWHFGIDQGKENVFILTVFVLISMCST
jgi:hypothetical protein